MQTVVEKVNCAIILRVADRGLESLWLDFRRQQCMVGRPG
jgi:hypothetical protein